MKSVIKGACLALVTTGIAMAAVQAQAAPAMGNMEKCYGIAKVGMNDCGGGKGQTHSCQGHGTKAGDKNDWLMVPTGLCSKIVGGSTTAGSN